jgi:hypothetical protein
MEVGVLRRTAEAAADNPMAGQTVRWSIALRTQRNELRAPLVHSDHAGVHETSRPGYTVTFVTKKRDSAPFGSQSVDSRARADEDRGSAWKLRRWR